LGLEDRWRSGNGGQPHTGGCSNVGITYTNSVGERRSDWTPPPDIRFLNL
jgi:hypothetical protein